MGFLTRFIMAILRKQVVATDDEYASRYRVAMAFYLLRLTFLHRLRDAVIVGIGVVVAGLGLKILSATDSAP